TNIGSRASVFRASAHFWGANTAGSALNAVDDISVGHRGGLTWVTLADNDSAAVTAAVTPGCRINRVRDNPHPVTTRLSQRILTPLREQQAGTPPHLRQRRAARERTRHVP